MCEVVARFDPQQFEDFWITLGTHFDRVRVSHFAARQIGRSPIGGQRGGNGSQRQHEIRHAGLDRVAGHAVIARLGRILHGRHTALRLDGTQPGAAIHPGAGQHHAASALAILVSERVKQEVERHAGTVSLRRAGQVQHALADRQIGPGRHDVQVPGLDRHAFDCLANGERSMRRQKGRHHAVAAGVEVLDKDERHSAICRPCFDQPGDRFEAAGRGTDGDDRQPRRWQHMASTTGQYFRNNL